MWCCDSIRHSAKWARRIFYSPGRWTKTRFLIDIKYELKEGFWDTANCFCEFELEERTPDQCRKCITRKLSVPTLYAEEKLLDSEYMRKIAITPLEERYCQQILEDGRICDNRKVLRMCQICEKPYCEEHLDDEGVCGSKECRETLQTLKNKEKKKRKK